MEKSVTSWDTIPNDIQREIASYLDVKSLCFFAATSKGSLRNAFPSLLQRQQTLLSPSHFSMAPSFGGSTFLKDASTGLYACGNNTSGQLGLGHHNNCNTFTPITSLKDKVLQVIAGGEHTLSLTDQGLFACGWNEWGQLGLGHKQNCNTFIPITSLKSKVLHVMAGADHTLALTDQGLFACGYNGYGQLGLGHNNHCNTFTSITSLKGQILQVMAGGDHTLALTDQGLFACGRNDLGQLGLGLRYNKPCNTFTLIQDLPKAVKARWSLYRHIQQLHTLEEPLSNSESTSLPPSFEIAQAKSL